jgi:succinate dehydrogenase / fumarate reductase cytochrome b subunit|tara:strand:- start:4947 stop:5270 length:324 start_codon:yes stop_codon:yes gene_type:complete
VIALASISHRIAGVVLFVGLAVLLYALEVSLSSEAGFETVKTWMNSAVGKVITWGLLSALAYHFVAGVKHLILDGSDAESLLAATWAARITLAVSAILMGLAAYWVI